MQDGTKKRGRTSFSEVEIKLTAKKKRGPTASPPTIDVRIDGVGHWPLASESQGCKFPGCKSKSTIKCKKCEVHLCLNKTSNCFFEIPQKVKGVSIELLPKCFSIDIIFFSQF